MDDVCIRGRRGTLHFIRFPTSEMGNFLALAKSKGMANLVTTVCATGGGAYKFEENFKKEVNLSLAKFDELDSLIRGMLYIEMTNPCEVYYYADPTDDDMCQKMPYDFSKPYPFLVYHLIFINTSILILLIFEFYVH